MAGLQTVSRWRDAAACLLCLISAGIVWAEPSAEEEISESDYRRRIVAREAKSLRLLPQPLYRYGGDESGSEDGAIFAYVVGTDPELILQIEAKPDGQGKPRWQYAISRRTSAELRVLLKSKVVWTAAATQGGFDEPFYVRPAR